MRPDERPTAPAPAKRLVLIDAARGIALLAMVAYHFSWDLRYSGFLTANVESDLGWVVFARSIAVSFLFIVGVSLVLSERGGFRPKHFLRRLGIVAASAAAVTIVTWFVFPDTFVFFGILHHVAVASVLGLAFVRAPVVVTAAAAVFSVAAPSLFAGPAFDARALVWLGLYVTPPRSNDFVPLFPWFGAVLAGIAAARLWPRLGPWAARLEEVRAPAWLTWIGRHTLVIYLVHQPILFGLVDLAARVYPPDLLGFEPAYLESCVASCVESDEEASACEATCACIASRAQAAGLWRDMMRQTLSVEQEMTYFTLVDACRPPEGQP